MIEHRGADTGGRVPRPHIGKNSCGAGGLEKNCQASRLRPPGQRNASVRSFCFPVGQRSMVSV